MRIVHLVMIAVGLVIAFAIGYLVGAPLKGMPPTNKDLAHAQTVNNRYLPPIWIEQFSKIPQLKFIRERGYRYCYHDKKVDQQCGREQDEATQNVFFALKIAQAQSLMSDYRNLSLREQEVARDSQLRSNVMQYCWRLYKSHGGGDARVLAVCLGNLTEFSPLVPIPVP